MSLRQLVDNWASDLVRDQFVIDQDGQEDWRDYPLVFVATLWSGKSQRSFRTLCDVMSLFPPTRMRVLLLDHEQHIPEKINRAVSRWLIASGPVLKVLMDDCVLVGTGEDPARLHADLLSRFGG